MSKIKRYGGSTVKFASPPVIVGYACVGSKKEGEGPLAAGFDYLNDDGRWGEKSWEKAESHMQKEALEYALGKSSVPASSIDYVLAGDLLNQCIGSTFGLRGFSIPFFGLYGACSTMAESMMLGSMLIDGGFAAHVAAMTSSHFCSAERQYRFPLDYGSARTPTAQWTATAAGAVLLAETGTGVRVTHATTGIIIDLGVTDANNMGAAMAPAAHNTLKALFEDTCTSPSEYDLILTGDLGAVGRQLVTELFEKEGTDIASVYNDCGCLLYDLNTQDVKAGGSGCGCSAAVLCAHVLPGMLSGQWHKVVFAGTGALLSPVSTQQGESIPSICHAVVLEI